jgi:hypothetical protein
MRMLPTAGRTGGCGVSRRRLTQQERENLAHYFMAVELAIRYEERETTVPLLDEYCWMHFDQPDGGGWRCAVCWAEQQAAKETSS